MIEINDRYCVHPVGDKFAIRDLWWRGFCSLDGTTPLQWPIWQDAQRWLDGCYRVWGFVPCVGEDPNDLEAKARNWARERRLRAGKSPWEDWTTPIPPDQLGYPSA